MLHESTRANTLARSPAVMVVMCHAGSSCGSASRVAFRPGASPIPGRAGRALPGRGGEAFPSCGPVALVRYSRVADSVKLIRGRSKAWA